MTVYPIKLQHVTLETLRDTRRGAGPNASNVQIAQLRTHFSPAANGVIVALTAHELPGDTQTILELNRQGDERIRTHVCADKKYTQNLNLDALESLKRTLIQVFGRFCAVFPDVRGHLSLEVCGTKLSRDPHLASGGVVGFIQLSPDPLAKSTALLDGWDSTQDRFSGRVIYPENQTLVIVNGKESDAPVMHTSPPTQKRDGRVVNRLLAVIH